ncbi:MAG: OmpH family outer membrane protein [Alphaproteobacteria bacterium]
MKNKSLLVAVFLLGVSPVLGDTPPAAPAVMFVDNNQVLAESAAMRDVQNQIEKKRSEFQKEISGKETSLRQENEKLMAQEKKLSADQFKVEQKKFEEKVEKIKGLVESRRRQLEIAYAQAMEKIQKSFQAAVQKAVQKNKATVVLQKAAALWISDPKLDLTAEVVALLNKDVSKLKVVFPSEQDASVLPENPLGSKKQ